MTDHQQVLPRRNASLAIEPLPQATGRLPSPVFERLHALVRKGYVADIGAERDTDLVVLRHRARAPDLVLLPDGVVEGFDGRRPFYKRNIEPPARIGTNGADEQLRFMRFLDTIPRASLRDRTRRWRHRYLYFPIALFAVWGACILLTGTIFNL